MLSMLLYLCNQVLMLLCYCVCITRYHSIIVCYCAIIAIMLLHVLVSPYNSLYFAINAIMLPWYVVMREYKLLKCCITQYIIIMLRFTGVNQWIIHTEKLILSIAKRVLAWIAIIIICKSCIIIISVVHNYKSLLMVHSYVY